MWTRWQLYAWMFYGVCWLLLLIPGLITILQVNYCTSKYYWLYAEAASVSLVILLVDVSVMLSKIEPKYPLVIVILLGPWLTSLACLIINAMLLQGQCRLELMYPITVQVLTFLSTVTVAVA